MNLSLETKKAKRGEAFDDCLAQIKELDQDNLESPLYISCANPEKGKSWNFVFRVNLVTGSWMKSG